MMKLMQELIKIIHAYQPAAREQLFTFEHKAHILWIIYLQGREWAKGTATTLQIFTNMMETSRLGLVYMLLGICENKKCRRDHTDIAKEKVPLTLQKFKPFLEEPEAVWKFTK